MRMKKIGDILIGVLIVLFMCIPQVLGQDVQVDSDPTQSIVQNEISLTCIPGSQAGLPSLLLAAYNDNPYYGGNGLGYSYSTDGGAIWSSGQLPFPVNNFTGMNMTRVFDPTVTSDNFGNVFVGHIADDMNGYSGLYVHKSSDGGVSWSLPVVVAVDNMPSNFTMDPNYRFNDRCQITADTYSTSSYTNNVYITWIKDRGLNMPLPWSDIYFSFSNNSGSNFSIPVRVNELIHNMSNIPIPAVASDGTVYVVWLDYNVLTGGTGHIFLDKSTDGGVTWGSDKLVNDIDLPPLNVFTGAGLSDALAKGGTPMAVSPSNPNELYIVYAADPDGILGSDDADIHFIKSTDGGSNWSTFLRVNDDATTNDQILPWIDVKSDGTIDIVWYDRRNDPNDMQWDIYIARSVDGGNSFSTNAKVNSKTFSTPSNSWMGEYLGLAVDSQYAYVVFTSTAVDMNGDIYFNKIQNSAIPAYPPNNPSNPNPADFTTGVDINTTLGWTGGDPDTVDTVTYDVYFGNTTSPPKVSNKQTLASYNPGTLNYNTTYYWKIKAWDNHGNSATGPMWSFTTKTKPIIPNNQPNKPSNPSPVDGQTNVNISVNLTWVGGDIDTNDTVTYDVYYGNVSPPSKTVSNQSETYYVPGSVDYNTTYYWQIIAWDNHGTSTSGDIWSFTTEPKEVISSTDGNGTIEEEETEINVWLWLFLILVIIVVLLAIGIVIVRKKK